MNDQKTKTQDKETYSNSSNQGTNPNELIPVQIPETPFKSVKLPTGIAIVLGKWVVSKKRFNSHEEAAEWVNNVEWDLIANLAGAYVEKNIEEQFQKHMEALKNQINTLHQTVSNIKS